MPDIIRPPPLLHDHAVAGQAIGTPTTRSELPDDGAQLLGVAKDKIDCFAVELEMASAARGFEVPDELVEIRQASIRPAYSLEVERHVSAKEWMIGIIRKKTLDYLLGRELEIIGFLSTLR